MYIERSLCEYTVYVTSYHLKSLKEIALMYVFGQRQLAVTMLLAMMMHIQSVSVHWKSKPVQSPKTVAETLWPLHEACSAEVQECVRGF